MLYGIDPILGPELLHALRAMGHGDELVIVDANYPALSKANRLVRLDGVDAVRVLDAVLSLMPLDDFVDCAAFTMEPVDDPKAVPEVCPPVPRGRREAGARLHDRHHRALRLLRAGREDLRHHRQRRAPALRQHHPEEGCHPAGRRLGAVDRK